MHVRVVLAVNADHGAVAARMAVEIFPVSAIFKNGKPSQALRQAATVPAQ